MSSSYAGIARSMIVFLGGWVVTLATTIAIVFAVPWVLSMSDEPLGWFLAFILSQSCSILVCKVISRDVNNSIVALLSSCAVVPTIAVTVRVVTHSETWLYAISWLSALWLSFVVLLSFAFGFSAVKGGFLTVVDAVISLVDLAIRSLTR